MSSNGMRSYPFSSASPYRYSHAACHLFTLQPSLPSLSALAFSVCLYKGSFSCLCLSLFPLALSLHSPLPHTSWLSLLAFLSILAFPILSSIFSNFPRALPSSFIQFSFFLSLFLSFCFLSHFFPIRSSLSLPFPQPFIFFLLPLLPYPTASPSSTSFSNHPLLLPPSQPLLPRTRNIQTLSSCFIKPECDYISTLK